MEMENQRGSFIMYSSFHEALSYLDDAQYGCVMKAVCNYAINGILPNFNDNVCEMAFTLIKPQIDANNNRYEKSKKGGAPKGNKNAKKQPVDFEKQPVDFEKQPVDFEKQPKTTDGCFFETTKNNLKQPNVNVNVNENVNVNVNVNENANVNAEKMYISAEKRLFLHLWQNTKDSDGHCIFQITAAIERPKDWERFWQVSPPTCEQIEKAFKNFADGINSGTIARQYIPATPDRFVLKNGISRYQDPVKDSKKKDKEMDFPDDRISL